MLRIIPFTNAFSCLARPHASQDWTWKLQQIDALGHVSVHATGWEGEPALTIYGGWGQWMVEAEENDGSGESKLQRDGVLLGLGLGTGGTSSNGLGWNVTMRYLYGFGFDLSETLPGGAPTKSWFRPNVSQFSTVLSFYYSTHRHQRVEFSTFAFDDAFEAAPEVKEAPAEPRIDTPAPAVETPGPSSKTPTEPPPNETPPTENPPAPQPPGDSGTPEMRTF